MCNLRALANARLIKKVEAPVSTGPDSLPVDCNSHYAMAALVIVQDLAGEQMVVVVNEEVVALADRCRGLPDIGRWLFCGFDGNLSNEEKTSSKGLPKSFHKVITVVLFDAWSGASRLLCLRILYQVISHRRLLCNWHR